MTLASVIIDNYNYASFLRAAIDSALAQTHADTEVIVVDDGSTDGSVDIVGSYGSRIRAICKQNGGQASAVNAGFAASRGDVVLILDSDDVLYPDAVETVLRVFSANAGVSRAQWRLDTMDVSGSPADRSSYWARARASRPPLDEGDLAERVLKGGPFTYQWSGTSGNAWSRRFLEEAMPIPERAFLVSVDVYLSAMCPLYGSVRVVDRPLGAWRDHGRNSLERRRKIEFETELRLGIDRFEACLESMAAAANRLGFDLDPEEWRSNSWVHRIRSGAETICDCVPEGEGLVLVDSDAWATNGAIRGRRCFAFTERNGMFWGLPACDPDAIEELERHRQAGARFLCIVWDHLWILEAYPGLAAHVEEQYPRIVEDRNVRIHGLG